MSLIYTRSLQVSIPARRWEKLQKSYVESDPITHSFHPLVTCRLHDVDPYEYLIDVLQRAGQHPASLVEQLTPRVWKTLFAKNPLRSDLYQRDERQSRQ